MSFSGRLTRWLLAALAPVMIGHGVFVYLREVRQQEREVTDELDLYARLVQRAVEQTQRERGWEDALRLGQSLEPRELSFAADHRFLWVRPPAAGPSLEAAPPEVGAMAQDSGDRLVRLDSPDHRWRVYRLVRGSDGAVGAVVVSHDTRDVEEFVRTTAEREALVVLLMALAAALVVALVGRFQVRPVVQKLIEQARRIDASEPVAPAPIGVEDEITRLGIEMNRMEHRIAEARTELESETRAKLAMAAQLRHADRLALVGRLSAGVAHEFGTPLTVVRGRAQLLANSPDVTDDERTSARSIIEQVDRMSRIIRQLLDLARRRGPPEGPCNLGELVARVADMLDHEAGRSRVKLECGVPSRPLHALGDLQQLEQVALNLVINAIHALDAKGGTVSLRCGSDPAAAPPDDSGAGPGPYVWFEVEDDGPGIAEEILPAVFEPFVTTKEPGRGTGLGLPLSAGIIRDHGGWIAVTSAPGQGACFRVYLKPYQGAASS